MSPEVRGLYHVVSYGCQMNAHESEKIAGLLEKAGYVPTCEPAEADVLVLNTCCVRDSAEQRIIGHIGTLKKYKQRRPDMKIAVVGCLTQRRDAAERLARTFPFVDIILGTQDLSALSTALERMDPVRDWQETKHLNDAVDERDRLPAVRAEGPSAQINIMYGCDNFCTYCIVPHVRGPERSRGAAAVLEEAWQLEQAGYREVQLLGQNVNSYCSEVDFCGLLERLLAETAIDRIRFMTSHPKDLSDRLIELISREKRLCSHIHLPLQSGSDAVLRRMNRRYTAAQYLDLADRIRSAVPDITLTTDLIVGFPGETDADFAETLAMVEKVRFASAYTFVYSPRRGTPAAAMPNQVSKETKKRRIMKLIDLQQAVTHELNRERIGRTEQVLVTGLAARGTGDMTGRSDGGRTVNFPGPESMTGRIVPVRITDAKSSTLYGQLEV